jgi:hypothetical protein
MIGWKACLNETKDGVVIVELEIPEEALVTPPVENFVGTFYLFNKKQRTNKAVVKSLSNGTKAFSWQDNTFEYCVGKTVTPNNGTFDISKEGCEVGIHFFQDKEQALKLAKVYNTIVSENPR